MVVIMSNVIGYARTSTFLQETSIELQEKRIKDFVKMKKWTLLKIFKDEGKSGANTDRPQWQKLIEAAETQKPHAIVFTKLDRVGRSLKDLLLIADKLNSLNVNFVAIDDSIDTSGAQGKLMFQIMGAFTEYERSIIRQRLVQGMEAAKARGKKFGRKPVQFNEAEMMRLYKLGAGAVSLANIFKVSRSTIYARIKDK